mmetsp:Transcript_71143/g.200728  ORF Transcript_71143/g.200728 Transcript_71143/m.200728 type:complete len:454 (-) Transcript_71143:33-1394(-)
MEARRDSPSAENEEWNPRDGAFPRAHLRVQGRRPPVPREPLRVHPREEEAADGHPRRNERRHRERRDLRRPGQEEHRLRHHVPGRPDVQDAGEADGDRAGREHHHAGPERDLRRLPGHCEGQLQQPAEAAVLPRRGQLHQLRPDPRADRVLRVLLPPAPPEEGGVLGAHRELRRHPGRVLREGHGLPSRGAARGVEHERRAHAVLRDGRVPQHGRAADDVPLHGHRHLLQLRALPLRRRRGGRGDAQEEDGGPEGPQALRSDQGRAEALPGRLHGVLRERGGVRGDDQAGLRGRGLPAVPAQRHRLRSRREAHQEACPVGRPRRGVRDTGYGALREVYRGDKEALGERHKADGRLGEGDAGAVQGDGEAAPPEDAPRREGVGRDVLHAQEVRQAALRRGGPLLRRDRLLRARPEAPRQGLSSAGPGSWRVVCFPAAPGAAPSSSTFPLRQDPG